MRKLTVVTNEHGAVVGTQLGHGDTPDAENGITVALTAGPGQAIHKIEFDVPRLCTRADLEEFHKKLGEYLKARKHQPSG